MILKIEDLKTNPNHHKIYRTNNIDELKESIEELGLLEKIVVNTDNIIISGFRRYLALKELGHQTVDVEIKDVKADDMLLLISFNQQRIKSNRELLNEIKYLKSIWGKKRGRKNSKEKIIQLTPDKTDTRTKISNHLKISNGNISKLEYIDREAPELIAQIDRGELSISQAYSSIINLKKVDGITQDEQSAKELDNSLNFVQFKVKDEYYTPRILVEPIMKYVPKGSTIWAPFDSKDSEFVRLFQENGYKVIYSHIWMGQDFFEYEPTEKYDYIISNPPFSKKMAVLERLFSLDKPWAMLLGLPILNYQEVSNFFVGKDLQLLIVDKKVSFDGNTSSFNNSYFCHKMLPKNLIFEHLEHNNSGKNFEPSRWLGTFKSIFANIGGIKIGWIIAILIGVFHDT